MNLRCGTNKLKDERREEACGGGLFGWGGRFGWSNGDHFWQKAQKTDLSCFGYYCHGMMFTFPFWHHSNYYLGVWLFHRSKSILSSS